LLACARIFFYGSPVVLRTNNKTIELLLTSIRSGITTSFLDIPIINEQALTTAFGGAVPPFLTCQEKIPRSCHIKKRTDLEKTTDLDNPLSQAKFIAQLCFQPAAKTRMPSLDLMAVRTPPPY
jgi:hypothetical protein